MSIKKCDLFYSEDSRNIEDKTLALMLKEVCHDTR